MGSYVTDEDRASFLTADTETPDALESDDTSDGTPETPEAPPAEEDTPDEGDEEGTAAPVEEAEEPEAEQPPGDKYTVKIDGQDVQVTHEELVNGYLRQSDYTRKAQQVANERRRLADAELVMQKLDENPNETLAVLARHYGVELFDSEGEPVEVAGPTPEQVQLRELQAWQMAELQRQKQAAVDAEIDRLHTEYGEFDDEALFGFAVDHQVANLETALRAMNYNRSAPDKRVEKRKASAMAGGQGSNGVAKPKAPVEQIGSFRDAYEAAKRELTGT